MKLVDYLKATKEELRQVTWPTTSQTINFTILVIIISLVVAISLGGVDFVLKTVLTKLLTK